MDKEKQIFTIINDADKEKASKAIFALVADVDTPSKVVITPGSEDRTTKQRRLQFMWYKQRGDHGYTSKDHEEYYCKLTFGVPILRCDDDEFDDFFREALDHLNYEQQLSAMKYIPVTRLMTVKQNVEYLNDIERDSLNKGWILTHPDDIYYEALMRKP